MVVSSGSVRFPLGKTLADCAFTGHVVRLVMESMVGGDSGDVRKIKRGQREIQSVVKERDKVWSKRETKCGQRERQKRGQ